MLMLKHADYNADGDVGDGERLTIDALDIYAERTPVLLSGL